MECHHPARLRRTTFEISDHRHRALMHPRRASPAARVPVRPGWAARKRDQHLDPRLWAWTGHRGGQINHPEIRLVTDVLPTDPMAGWTANIELLINHVRWFTPWQTLHFFGYSLIFGTALAVSLRVLGLWKSMSFAAIHRLLPLGVFGVVMNVFSGMLILQADSSRYLNEITFVPKVTFITIGGIAVLYYSLSDRLWNLKAGEDAPMAAKWVAALVLLSWTGVIMGGRLLPYV
jgi:hypothetical protein